MDVHVNHKLRHRIQPFVDRCKGIAANFGCIPDIEEEDVTETSYSENIFISENR